MGRQEIYTNPVNWQSRAFNQVPDSDNRIHSDELAKAYGFTGALVPGVTVSCYLAHPAVEAWGLPWLERGAAHVTVRSPLYDEHEFRVTVTPSENSCEAVLLSGGRVCAEGLISLPVMTPACPVQRSDIAMRANYVAPVASREVMEAFKAYGCPAKSFLWSADHEMATYLREQSQMSSLHRTDEKAGSGGYANLSFVLGCANRHFAAVAKMSPWIHLETWSQNFQSIPLGTELVSEMRVVNLFEKKGHEFADCEFNLFRADDGSCVCSISQRAIYLMREP
ncbi:MAG: hypothetical protein Q8K97_17025 [Pseudohongiella sp.]|nr:hypothetical protein [Pseudohongiella sp.]MDP2129072.1 hypothetical protein [Pseudohongiella sp.]